MAKWLVWLLAVTTAIFASPLSMVQPAAGALARVGTCTGTPHCAGPPPRPAPHHGVQTAALAVRGRRALPARLRPALEQAPRMLTPAQVTPSLNVQSPPANVLEVGGRSFLIVSRLRMLASAYQTGEPGVGTITYTGTRARVGEVAVDPRFMPLGTWMFVTGYHTPYFPPHGLLEHAEDIGGAIKGDRLDMYMSGPPEALAQFAGQWVTVYVLKPRVAGAGPTLPLGSPR